MTETKPMTTADQQQATAGNQHKVRVGDREMSLAEARAGMSPAIAHRIEQQLPRAADNPALAQQFIDAYAEAHHREHGQHWTGALHTDAATTRPASPAR